MAIGRGRYDDLCTIVREQTNARGAVVIVIDDPDGNGFSVQADTATTLRLPSILESMAKQIRGDISR